MLLLQLFVDGVVSGCAVGVVAITFAYVYATTGVFHVAHAGVFTLGGYVAWWLSSLGLAFPLALAGAVAISAAVGAAMQKGIYETLIKRRATPLVQLIASLGLLAILQNLVALLFTPNLLQFEAVSWRLTMTALGPIHLSIPQIATMVSSLVILAGLILFSTRTILGKRIRAVSSNRSLAEITRLRPFDVYVVVVAIASGLVAVPSIFIGVDQAMQPYTSVLVLLTAVIAVIAGGIGSLPGAFIISVVLAVLQNLVLALMPGRWSIAFTFILFIVFILIMPTGLFQTRLKRAS
jgi:branched-chain amino acid transport system permease protein